MWIIETEIAFIQNRTGICGLPFLYKSDSILSSYVAKITCVKLTPFKAAKKYCYHHFFSLLLLLIVLCMVINLLIINIAKVITLYFFDRLPFCSLIIPYNFSLCFMDRYRLAFKSDMDRKTNQKSCYGSQERKNENYRHAALFTKWRAMEKEAEWKRLLGMKKLVFLELLHIFWTYILFGECNLWLLIEFVIPNLSQIYLCIPVNFKTNF